MSFMFDNQEEVNCSTYLSILMDMGPYRPLRGGIMIRGRHHCGNVHRGNNVCKSN